MIWIFGTRGGAGRALARPLLAEAARRAWGLEELPVEERGAHGKPFFPGRPELQFSLSHSGELVLCALSRRSVGVDVERVRPRGQALLDRTLTGEERAWCMAQEDPWRGFCTLWTRRESLCKQTGRGLTFPVRDIPVPLPPAQRCGGLIFRNYHGEDWTAALCGEEEPPEEILWLSARELRGTEEGSAP